ncbi:hypothetical protein ACFLYY_00160 [Patescibacteria group bacterium]
MKKDKGISLILVIIIIVGVLSVTGGIYYFLTNKTQESFSCPQETNICPDGSAVSRIGPDCEFAECPIDKISTISETSDTSSEEKDTESARNAARDMGIQARLDQIALTAEIIYDMTDGYQINCNNDEFNSLCDEIGIYTDKEPVFHSNQESYCMYIELINGNYYCIAQNNNGFGKTETSIYPGTKGYCDGSTHICPK